MSILERAERDGVTVRSLTAAAGRRQDLWFRNGRLMSWHEVNAWLVGGNHVELGEVDDYPFRMFPGERSLTPANSPGLLSRCLAAVRDALGRNPASQRRGL